MSNGKLNINDWAEEDRPRERLERLGAEWLSNAELLAILIGSGNAHQTAVDLMKQVLGDCNNNLNTLGKTVYQGLGEIQRHRTSQGHHNPCSVRTGQTASQREGRGAERPGIGDGHLQFYAPTNAGP